MGDSGSDMGDSVNSVVIISAKMTLILKEWSRAKHEHALVTTLTLALESRRKFCFLKDGRDENEYRGGHEMI